MKNNLRFEFEQKDAQNEVQKIEIELLKSVESIDEELFKIDEKLISVGEDISRLTNHADAWDYGAAIVSGILTGLIDSFFVGAWDFKEGYDWASKKTEDLVINVGKMTKCEGKDLKETIRKLEEKFGMPTDCLTKDFGGGVYHHLFDFAHHASIFGLAFSLITQFTKKAIGTDKFGVFKVVDVTNLALIGENVPQKIFFGVVLWLLHIVSDMAGSSNSPGAGTGVPGFLLSLLKLISATPIFNSIDPNNKEKTINKLSSTITKLFKGKAFEGKFDLRGEMAVLHQIGKQATPVLINEMIVRSFYFIRRLIIEIKDKKSLTEINWENTNPFNNRTIERMMTIATGTFTAVDSLDAIICGTINSKGSWLEFFRQVVLRINIPGIGRFAIAGLTDIGMGIKKGFEEKELMQLKNQALCLMQAKMYHGETLLWQAQKDANQSIGSLFDAIEQNSATILQDLNASDKSAEEIKKIDFKKAEEKNVGLLDDIFDNL